MPSKLRGDAREGRRDVVIVRLRLPAERILLPDEFWDLPPVRDHCAYGAENVPLLGLLCGFGGDLSRRGSVELLDLMHEDVVVVFEVRDAVRRPGSDLREPVRRSANLLRLLNCGVHQRRQRGLQCVGGEHGRKSRPGAGAIRRCVQYAVGCFCEPSRSGSEPIGVVRDVGDVLRGQRAGEDAHQSNPWADSARLLSVAVMAWAAVVKDALKLVIRSPTSSVRP
ncbi:hypothetical protein ACL00T_00970 [Curtobacterium flaccumfaciens]